MASESIGPRVDSMSLHPIGDLYQHWALDYVIEATRALAQDCVEKPDVYRDLPDEIGAQVASFNTRVGIEPGWPDFHGRNALYNAQLGPWFSEAAGAFRSAVVAYVERSNETSRSVTTPAMLDAVVALRAQLGGGQEEMLLHQQATATKIFDAAVEVLRCDEVARKFGVAAAPGDPWPFGGLLEVDGSELIGAIAQAFFPEMIGRMTRYKFLLLQRVAHHGAVTLSRVLDRSRENSEDFLGFVLEPAYSWCLAVRELMPVSTIVSAWRREHLRRNLTEFERSLVPDHPAGTTELTTTELEAAIARARLVGGGVGLANFGGQFGFAAETHTVGDDVCCSTGDLSCNTDASCMSVVEHCPTEGGCPTDPGGLSCGGPCGTDRHHC